MRLIEVIFILVTSTSCQLVPMLTTPAAVAVEEEIIKDIVEEIEKDVSHGQVN